MARGLFIIYPGHGHVNPTIGLVKGLIDKGDEITYITTEEFREKIEGVGAKFKGYRPNDLRNKSIDIHESSLKLAFEEEGTFDYLVIDPFINPGTKIVEKFKIKKIISTITTFALGDEMIEFIMKFNAKRMALNPMDSPMARPSSDFSKLNKLYGVKMEADKKKFIKGIDVDLRLVFTSKYYQPLSESFDDTYKFVGASIYNRNDVLDFKVENPEKKKIVYISLGTISNKNISFYEDCFKALGDNKDILVIMSVGKFIDFSKLGDIPDNFSIYKYVPQLELLKQVDLFITHGGMNSSSEALYNNVPLIVVPQMAEQPIVAKRIEELKAGINLMGNVTVEGIKNSVEKVLNNSSYKANAQKIGESFIESGGYAKAVDYIHEII